MKEISIGKVLIEKRKEKEITQDEVAKFVGVSKSSVSKWETGQSYPDIAFLPVLASYFDISIDTLIGYEPQMCKEDIRKLYRRLATEFVTKPFESVLEEVRQINKKYYSCYPLLLQMGFLILNHSNLEKDPEKAKKIIVDTKDIFCDVRKKSEDFEIAKQAALGEAYCALALGKAVEVLDILGDSSRILLIPEILVASAFQMLEKEEKAKEILQAGIYQQMLGTINLLLSYLSLYIDDIDQYEIIVNRILEMSDTFDLEHLHPAGLITSYITIAQGYIKQGKEKECLDMLQRYADLSISNIYPMHLKGDDFFDCIEDWFEDLDLGNGLPRDEKMVKQSMLEAVTKNPEFEKLKSEPEFKRLVEKLKENKRR